MPQYKVEVSELAENDLRDIVRYVSSQLAAPMTALNMLETIENALLGLRDMPYGFSAVRDEQLASMGYHRLDIKNYTAFYTIDEKQKAVYVVRILYARRDWINLL